MPRAPRKSTQRDPRAEFALIERIAAVLSGGRGRGRRVELGIGDDAAVLRVGDERLAVTVDDHVEGVHFDRRWLAPEDIGYRSFHAAASDLAAMGAEPLGAVSALHVSPSWNARAVERVVAGQARAARELRCPVVGGNVARSATFAVGTTVLGTVRAPLQRSGARPGDELWLIGEVGLARAGYLLLERGGRRPQSAARAIAAWRRPVALIRDGLALVARATAALDVSDGLSGDAPHLARSSRVRVVIEEQRLGRALAPELAKLAPLLGESALELGLRGGEDYALLAAGPASRRPRRARVIGRIERGRGALLELASGERRPLDGGFDHLH